MQQRALFIGLTSLDLIYLTAQFPQQNEKVVAEDYTIAAGGPATNAAITFTHLSKKEAQLLTVLGQHPLTNLIKADLESFPLQVTDLIPEQTSSPPVSSIIATKTTGERAVISLNAVKTQATTEQLPENILQGVEIILIDGHQMAISRAIASQAKDIPVVVDGGSWKPGFEEVLPYVDYAICSANFFPPGCQTKEEVFKYLQDLGIPHIAITQGEKPILYIENGKPGELAVPEVNPVDTLGAGDIFHGAFTYYILREDFLPALRNAAKVASHACQFFGTRQWIMSE